MRSIKLSILKSGLNSNYIDHLSKKMANKNKNAHLKFKSNVCIKKCFAAVVCTFSYAVYLAPI